MPATAAVPVQLTTITPVRVFDIHGEFFDTELDLHTPVRALQLAVADFFHIHPDTQLLLHNRQELTDYSGTLMSNGCQLLKGDPYVRLVCAVRRGPVLNLVIKLGGGGVVFPIAVRETLTVWEVKELIAAEAERRGRRTELCRAPRMRLQWRYMELNDRATLQYYRVPTNSVLSVRPRPATAAPPSAAPKARRVVAAPPALQRVDPGCVVDPRPAVTEHHYPPARASVSGQPSLEDEYTQFQHPPQPTVAVPLTQQQQQQQQQPALVDTSAALGPTYARIAELEGTVERLCALMQTAITLIEK